MKRLDAIRRISAFFIGLPFLGLKNPLKATEPELLCDCCYEEPAVYDGICQSCKDANEDEEPTESELLAEAEAYEDGLWPNDKPFPCQKYDCSFDESLTGFHPDCTDCRMEHNIYIKATDPEWYEDVVIDSNTGKWTDPYHTTPTGFDYGDVEDDCPWCNDTLLEGICRKPGCPGGSTFGTGCCNPGGGL